MKSELAVKKRYTGIELLRITAMFMILGLHYCGMGEASENAEGINLYFARFMMAFSYCCVNEFVLITGYFWEKNSLILPVGKCVKLYLQTIFYSVGCCLVFLCLGKSVFSLKEIVYSFAPLTTRHYWFVSVYILLLLITYPLNILIKNMDKRTHSILVFLILLLYCLPSTILPLYMTPDETGGYSLIWFIALYIIGAYLQKYEPLKKLSPLKCFSAYSLLCVMVFIAGVVLSALHQRFDIKDYWGAVYKYTSLPVVLSSVFLFEFFKKLEIKSLFAQRIIRTAAPLTLGVFLLHNNLLVRRILLKNILQVPSFYSSWLMPLHYIACVIAVFVVCEIVEYVRQRLFNNINIKISEKIQNSVIKIEENIFSRFKVYD